MEIEPDWRRMGLEYFIWISIFPFSHFLFFWTSIAIFSQYNSIYWTSMAIFSQYNSIYWTSMPPISQTKAYYWTSMPIMSQ